MTSGEFFKSLLNRNVHPKGGAPIADGRALFAYRCTDEEFRLLDEMAKTGGIRRLLDGIQNDDIYAPALLCLFAAERLRRYHDGGPFKWENALGGKPKSVQKIYPEVARGLVRGWKRPIIEAKAQNELEYIYTLACEGGIPLTLLKNQSVREYFKTLQGIRAKQNAPICVDQVRKEMEAHSLGKIWQESYVCPLICDLINGISNLQTYLTPENDPVAQLDLNVPNWRDHLPLNVENAELSDLLTGLVTEMHRLTTPHPKRLRPESGGPVPNANGKTVSALKVKTLLTLAGGRWQLRRKIGLDSSFSHAQISKWFEHADVTSPLYLLVEHADSEKASVLLCNWAKLTRYSTATWKRNWLSDSEDQIRASSIYSRVRLVLDDEKRTEIPCLFGNVPKLQPLLFIEDNDGWLYRGACQTTSHIAAAEALLALPSHWVLMQASTELSVGDFDGLSLYRVTGEVLLTDEITDEERRLYCGTDDRGIADFQLRGNPLYEDLSPIQAFRGMPKLFATDTDGQSKPLPDVLKWRPVSTKDWLTDCHLAFGRITLGCGTAYREEINVLPPGFGIKPQIVKGDDPGHYRFSNTQGAKIECSCEGVTIRDGSLVCERREEPTPIEVRFSWSNPTRTVTLRLAYPQQSANFWLDELCVSSTDLVPACRLGGLSIRAMDQIENLPLLLFWDYEQALDCNEQPINFKFQKEQIDQRLTSAAQRGIADRLAESKSGKVLLELRQGGKSVVRCGVTHFAYELAYDAKRRELVLEIGHMRPDLVVKILRFDQSESEFLEQISLGQAAWAVGARLGVWCALVCQGNWACSKPIFFEVKPRQGGTMAPQFNEVAEMPVHKPSVFETALLDQGADELIQSMAKEPLDREWANFWKLLGMAESLGTAQFKPLKSFLMNTEFLCVALFQATRYQRATLFFLLKTLPICIEALPIDKLRSALQLWLKALESAGLPNEHTKLSGSDHSYWSSVCGLLVDASPSSIAARTSEFKLAPIVLDNLVLEQQSRHSEASEWPKTPEIERKLRDIHTDVLGCCPKQWQGLNASLRTFRLAPFVIAHQAFNGIALTRALRMEVRKLKAFDIEWFQAAFHIALMLYFAQGANRD